MDPFCTSPLLFVVSISQLTASKMWKGVLRILAGELLGFSVAVGMQHGNHGGES